jgi:indolepyruvate ferredoxin oxidoreductase alpha subunit
MIEAGTRVVTSYPGSPTPEIATAIRSIPKKQRPFYFEFSTNEKVATEVAYGAALNGHLSTVFFKSVGLNVAADTFVQLSMMNIIGGMIIVLGDDPGANSSQNEQDNRHIAQMCYTPVLEPATPAETYSFYLEAARLSVARQMPVILRLTTHVCHAKSKVHFDAWQPVAMDPTPRFDSQNGPYVPLTTEVHSMKRKALGRLEQFKKDADKSSLNRLVDNGNPDRGVITMGLPFQSLMDAVQKADRPPDIFKLGIVYPLPQQAILAFLASHARVKIIEELDDLVEKEIKALAFENGVTTRIIGKSDPEDWIGEYTPDKVYDIVQNTWPDMLPNRPTVRSGTPPVPARSPQMCPGCGHRSAFHAIKKALDAKAITVADIGCHTLGYLPPYEMGQLLMCMGASTAMGSGLSLFNNTRKVVAFIGDSTFFHAGLPGIINAVFNQHQLTLILMENDTTAMTGHQDHAASGQNFNAPTDKIPVRQVLEGLGVKLVFEVDTYQQAQLTDLVKQALTVEGFSVVIARHPCMLKFTRKQRKLPNFKLRQVAIDQDMCNRVYACVETFACPTFVRQADGRIEINPDLCIGDGSCVQTCPSQAIAQPQIVNPE